MKRKYFSMSKWESKKRRGKRIIKDYNDEDPLELVIVVSPTDDYFLSDDSIKSSIFIRLDANQKKKDTLRMLSLFNSEVSSGITVVTVMSLLVLVLMSIGSASIGDYTPAFSSALLEGDLYCIGGACISTDAPAYCFDSRGYLVDNITTLRAQVFAPMKQAYVFKDSCCEWESLPPMLAPRSRPAVICLDGKIFVFGCSLTLVDKLYPFAEVYDPSREKWEGLHLKFPPCFGKCDTAEVVCSLVEYGTSVLMVFGIVSISFTVPLICFSGIENRPMPMLRPMPIPTFSPQFSNAPSAFSQKNPIVVVRNLAFVFLNSNLYACKLTKGRFGNEHWTRESFRVKGDLAQVVKKIGPFMNPSFLFRVQGMNFRLVWANAKKLCCVRFRLVGKKLKDMRVKVGGYVCYPLQKCLLLDAKMEDLNSTQCF